MYKLDTLVDCPECDKILCIDTDVIIGTDIWEFYNKKVDKNIYFTLTDNCQNLWKKPYDGIFVHQLLHPNWGFGLIHFSNIKDRETLLAKMRDKSFASSIINPEEMLLRLN